jgi:DNA-binding XRE family transcriptional regulator
MEMEAMDVPFMIRKLTELYTQRELAKLLQVSAMTVTSWKKGWYRPNTERLTKLVELYHGAFTAARTEE